VRRARGATFESCFCVCAPVLPAPAVSAACVPPPDADAVDEAGRCRGAGRDERRRPTPVRPTAPTSGGRAPSPTSRLPPAAEPETGTTTSAPASTAAARRRSNRVRRGAPRRLGGPAAAASSSSPAGPIAPSTITIGARLGPTSPARARHAVERLVDLRFDLEFRDRQRPRFGGHLSLQGTPMDPPSSTEKTRPTRPFDGADPPRRAGRRGRPTQRLAAQPKRNLRRQGPDG